MFNFHSVPKNLIKISKQNFSMEFYEIKKNKFIAVDNSKHSHFVNDQRNFQ